MLICELGHLYQPPSTQGSRDISKGGRKDVRAMAMEGSYEILTSSECDTTLYTATVVAWTKSAQDQGSQNSVWVGCGLSKLYLD